MSKPISDLRQLELFIDAVRKARHPNLPDHARIKSRYDDTTANGLTRCIVDFLTHKDHFATHLSSTGTYREDLKKFVASQQRRGLPDVLGVVYGRALFVEVKIGRDRLSDDQKKTIAALQASEADVYVASSYEGFARWFETNFCRSPF